MNFEFLKDLTGLEAIYGPCTDAEELAISKPYLSMTAARKSAELLARFIYIASHYEAAEGISFVDILRDDKVRSYINNRSVENAFHHIRRSGNSAVHGENDEIRKEQAIAILEDLHYVAGETAKRLKLINNYPAFDSDIAENPNATFNEKQAVAEKAQEMFLSYLKEEREKHLVSFDSDNQAHYDYFSKSIAIMHEYLEFSKQTNMKTTLEYIKKYLQYIACSAVAIKDDEYDKECDDLFWDKLIVDLVLSVDDKQYRLCKEDCGTGKMPDGIIKGIQALETASTFSVDVFADGNFRGFYLDVIDTTIKESIRKIDEESPWMGHGMSEYLESIRRREQFTYKGIFVYNTHNYDSEVYYIKDGKSYNPELICTPDILNDQNHIIWTGSSIILTVDFDFDTYPGLIEKLHEEVRNSIPKEEVPYVEDIWEEEEYGVLLNGTDWAVDDLMIVQDFLNRINTILEPIKDSCTYFIEHCWYNLNDFAVAYIQVIDGKLMISGKKL